MKTTKAIVPVALVVALVTGFYFGRYQVTSVHAQKLLQAPNAWGSVTGAVGGYVIFQDAQGTVRFFDTSNGGVIIQINSN